MRDQGQSDVSGGAQPSFIGVPQAAPNDLQARLARTRWPDGVAGAGWDDGTDVQFLRS